MARTVSRDKQTNYTEVKHQRYSETYVWSQWANNEWQLVNNNSVVATIRFDTTKEKRNDMTGRKSYRIVTKHTVHIIYRLAYQTEIAFPPAYFSGGEKQVLLRLIELFENGWFAQEAKFTAWTRARNAGCSDYEMLKAENDNWNIDDDTKRYNQTALNLVRLAQVFYQSHP